MSNLNGFNADNVEPVNDFEPIPAGKYVAVITASEMKSNKAGTGSFLELTFQVIEGEYKNRQLWARLNLDNPNELAVKIARAQLATICKAVGVIEPKDSVELHNLPLFINVKVKRREDTDELTNEIKGFAKREITLVNNRQPRSGAAPWKR